jgi:CheY-like chemotaxis protein
VNTVRPFQVLLVDDNPDDIDLLRKGLKQSEVDCETTVISDGAEALAFARGQGKYAGSAAPDLTVIDLNLPKHGGIEILRAVRLNKDLQHLPVVIITSSASPREKLQAADLNVAAFITKPFDLEEFLEIGETLRSVLLKNSPAL